MVIKHPVVKLHDGTSLRRVSYDKLNSRRRENYNFAKVSAILADYGFMTMRLTDDWHGADFIAHDPTGGTLLVQLKPRLTIDKKYMRRRTGQQIYVCFPTRTRPRVWYMYHHDTLVKFMRKRKSIGAEAWARNTGQSRANPGKVLLAYLRTTGCELGAEAP